MLSRLIDYLKMKQITAFCTDLTAGRRAWSGPRWEYPRLWTPGFCCRSWRRAASATAACTSSSPAAWSIPIRSGNSSFPTAASSSGCLYRRRRGVDRLGQGRPGGNGEGRGAGADQEIERKQRDIERKKAVIEAQIAGFAPASRLRRMSWSGRSPRQKAPGSSCQRDSDNGPDTKSG